MLSLYRKFAMDVASIKRPRKMHFAGCELYPNERRELVCKTNQSEFIVADDVYVYYADDDAIWYSRCEDLSRGMDIVYRIDVNNIYDRRKGIIDDDTYFLYVENGYMYCENNMGDSLKLCALESIDSLSNLTGRKKELSIKNVENALGSEIGFRRYTDTEFYKDINELHSLVGALDEERKAEIYTSSISAKIIAKVIKMCCEMNKNISRPLQKIIEKEIV